MKYITTLIFLCLCLTTMADNIDQFEPMPTYPNYNRMRNIEQHLKKMTEKLNQSKQKEQKNLDMKFKELEDKIQNIHAPKQDLTEINKLIDQAKEELQKKHEEDIKSLRNEIQNVDYKISQNFAATLKSLREDIFKLQQELKEQRKLMGNSVK